MNSQLVVVSYGAKCCDLNLTPAEEDVFIRMSRAIGNPVRFQIVKHLNTHAGCITGDLVEVLPIAQATTSQHLKVLKQAGWIEGVIEGPATHYCLNAENVNKFKDIVSRL